MTGEPEEAHLETSYAEVTMLDEATVRAGFELLRPLFDHYGVYYSIESQEVQTAHADSTEPDNPEGIPTDEAGLDSNLATQTDYDLDHENPYHLQWAYEQADGSIGQAADHFSVSKTVVRDNLTEAGIHDPEAVNGPAEYRDEDTLREAFTDNNRDIEATADEFGVSTKTVRNWLNRYGIDTDPPWQDKERLQSVFTDCKEVVEWTADELDASPTTIRRWLRRFDLLNGEEPPEPEEPEEEISSTNSKSEAGVECEECGRDDFDSERAKNIHKTRTHGKDDEEESPGPVEPPEGDELSEADYDIDESEIQGVDISEYGYPYTTGNLAETLADCSSFDEVGVKLDVSAGEAQRLCARIGLSERFATGRDVDIEEVQRRLEIAVEKFDPEEAGDCGHLDEYKVDGDCLRCEQAFNTPEERDVERELASDSTGGAPS